MADCLPSINVCACIFCKIPAREQNAQPNRWIKLRHMIFCYCRNWHDIITHFSDPDRSFAYAHACSLTHNRNGTQEKNRQNSHGWRVIQNALQPSKILIATHFCGLSSWSMFSFHQNWKSNSFAHWPLPGSRQTVNATFNIIKCWKWKQNSCKISYWTDFWDLDAINVGVSRVWNVDISFESAACCSFYTSESTTLYECDIVFEIDVTSFVSIFANFTYKN